MQTPEDVGAMLRLHSLGWGLKRIARELGVDRNTVRRYVRAGGWVPYQNPVRRKALAGLEPWLKASFRQHRGNAEVVREELKREHGVEVSLRTVERAVAGLRRELRAEARATVRFETAPGRQLQVDFGQVRVSIGDERVTAHLCVMTLGYSRRICVVAHLHERQHQWLASFEEAFQHFGGVPKELLVDNARALVRSHDVQTREVVFNDRFRAFCSHWEVTPKACAPYRARTKGKDERAVGYVKRNAVAGRVFASWAAFKAHLARWTRETSDVRIHGTTGEQPIARFDRDEANALRPLNGRPPFVLDRELVRKVHGDLCIEVDTNHYSVPWRHIGREVSVLIARGEVRVLHGGVELARHAEGPVGARRWYVRPEHLEGVIARRPVEDGAEAVPEPPAPTPELLRSLAVYEDAVGGAW